MSEEELRESVEWITDRGPQWDERNMRAVQRFNRAIAELLCLRAELAARPVATRRFNRATDDEPGEGEW